MKYLVVTLGSAGDLHPFLAVARELAREGHDVEVMSNAPHEDTVRREGLEFSASCSVRDHERTAAHADLWHPIRGFGVLWRHLAVPAIEPVRTRVATWLGTGSGTDRIVLASPLAVGARLAREQHAFPLCSLYTAPANLRSVSDPMVLGAWRVPPWVPRFARPALWWALDRWKLEPLARPAIDAACQAQGSPIPSGSIFGRWIHSPDGGATLFPESFGAVQPDWAVSPIEMGAFPLFEASADVALDPSLQAFLSGDSPPVVIFPGSAASAGGLAFVRRALMACRALGLRAVVLGAAGSQAEASDDTSVFRTAHAPLSLLLARASVFVHHGGIGSCAQGLQARVPQLIQPFAYDQFDNAVRMGQLGAGRWVNQGDRAGLLSCLEELASGNGAMEGGYDAQTDGGAMNALMAIKRWQSHLNLA